MTDEKIIEWRITWRWVPQRPGTRRRGVAGPLLTEDSARHFLSRCEADDNKEDVRLERREVTQTPWRAA